MALPSSGALSFSAIAGELGVGSPYSLRSMSSAAGFSTPDSVSEFYGYGYITYTYYATYEAYAPCTGVPYDIYIGSDSVYYYDAGGTFDLMSNINDYWYEYLYYEPLLDADVYQVWIINIPSTVLTDDGLFLTSPCF